MDINRKAGLGSIDKTLWNLENSSALSILRYNSISFSSDCSSPRDGGSSELDSQTRQRTFSVFI